MAKINIIRSIGVVAGLGLCYWGMDMLVYGFIDPPTANTESYYFISFIYLITGLLFVMPWSKVKSNTLWIILFIGFILLVLLSSFTTYLMNIWAAIHGAGLVGNIIVLCLLLCGLMQLPALWLLRPNNKYE